MIQVCPIPLAKSFGETQSMLFWFVFHLLFLLAGEVETKTESRKVFSFSPISMNHSSNTRVTIEISKVKGEP